VDTLRSACANRSSNGCSHQRSDGVAICCPNISSNGCSHQRSDGVAICCPNISSNSNANRCTHSGTLIVTHSLTRRCSFSIANCTTNEIANSLTFTVTHCVAIRCADRGAHKRANNVTDCITFWFTHSRADTYSHCRTNITANWSAHNVTDRVTDGITHSLADTYSHCISLVVTLRFTHGTAVNFSFSGTVTIPHNLTNSNPNILSHTCTYTIADSISHIRVSSCHVYRSQVRGVIHCRLQHCSSN
jgi:hypothetical protein